MSSTQDSPIQSGQGGSYVGALSRPPPSPSSRTVVGATSGHPDLDYSASSLLSSVLERLDGLASRFSSLEARVDGPSQRGRTPPPTSLQDQAEDGDPPHQEEEYNDQRAVPSATARIPTTSTEFVPIALYRDKIRSGFERQRPISAGLDRPHYFAIDDPVTRHLTEKKHTARLSEYKTVNAYAFFIACANEALADIIGANRDEAVTAALVQVLNTLSVTEDMLRDRRAFLQIVGDPASDDNMLDYARHVLSNDFNPVFEGIGASEENNERYQRYCSKVDSSIMAQAASTRASRRFETSTDSDKPTSGGRGKKGAQAPPKNTQPPNRKNFDERSKRTDKGKRPDKADDDDEARKGP